MTRHSPQPIHLSPQGEQRRRDIGASLTRRARARRTGRTILTGAACLFLLIGAGVITRIALSSSARAPAPQPLAQKRDRQTPAAPAPREEPAAAKIVIVSNEPISDRPCGAGPSTQVPVCILNDAQLLSALSTTGQSYGLVRVGGRTMVVSNSAH